MHAQRGENTEGYVQYPYVKQVIMHDQHIKHTPATDHSFTEIRFEGEKTSFEGRQVPGRLVVTYPKLNDKAFPFHVDYRSSSQQSQMPKMPHMPNQSRKRVRVEDEDESLRERGFLKLCETHAREPHEIRAHAINARARGHVGRTTPKMPIYMRGYGRDVHRRCFIIHIYIQSMSTATIIKCYYHPLDTRTQRLNRLFDETIVDLEPLPLNQMIDGHTIGAAMDGVMDDPIHSPMLPSFEQPTSSAGSTNTSIRRRSSRLQKTHDVRANMAAHLEEFYAQYGDIDYSNLFKVPCAPNHYDEMLEGEGEENNEDLDDDVIDEDVLDQAFPTPGEGDTSPLETSKPMAIDIDGMSEEIEHTSDHATSKWLSNNHTIPKYNDSTLLNFIVH